MKRVNYFFILVQVAFLPALQAHPNPDKLSRAEYIERFKSDAVKDMLKTGVPASITLAQAVFESDNGNSMLARTANNHFGIKCHKEWGGETHNQDDDHKNECFRKYNSVLESYDDHSNFLRTRERYAFLFSLPKTDYKAWASGLKQAGYATNPNYPAHLIKIIEENQLYVLDTISTIENISVEKKIYNGQKAKSLQVPEITEVSINSQRKIMELNRTQYIITRKDDNIQSLSKEFDMMPWQVQKYNDLKKTDVIKAGEIIFLKPKRNKAEQDFHITKTGETMRDISQRYGIKLNSLYKNNRMEEGTQPVSGEKLWLSKKKPA